MDDSNFDNFQMDGMSLYNSVASGDYISIFHGFVLAATKSIVSAYPVPGRGATRSGPIFNEEKLDEFFTNLSSQHAHQKIGRQPRGHTNAATKTDPCYNLLLVELLNSLLNNNLSVFDEKEKVFMEVLSQEEDKCMKNVGWRHPRRRKSKQSILQQMHEDEEEAMRFSAKLMSNTRPPANFILHNKISKRMELKEKDDDQKMGVSSDASVDSSLSSEYNSEDDMNDESDFDDRGPPLFDGSIGNNTGSLLHLACIVDEPFILAMLLILGAEPRSKHSAFRRLPIHEAACSNSSDCLTFLLELSKRFNNNNSEESTRSGGKIPVSTFYFPMLFKSPQNHSRTMQSNFSPSSTPDTSKVTSHFPFLATLRVIQCLVEQISSNKLSPLAAAKELIERAPLPHQSSMSLSLPKTLAVTDGHGNTALHWAAFKNCAQSVSILLAAGANPNAPSMTTGWTPLHDAAYSDAPEATRLLLEGGADANARANSGATPLCFAAQEDAPRAAEILLQAGADTSVRCCGHSYTASLALPDNRNGHNLVLPPPMITSRFSGYTPLHYCAHYNASQAAKVLIKYGAPIEIYDLADRLPIHVAVGRGSSDVLRELLIAGAKVDVERNEPDHNMEGSDGHSMQMMDTGIHQSHEQNQSESRAATMNGSVLNGILGRNHINTSSMSSSTSPNSNVITPASSPVLKQMLPRQPVNSTKPWNCLSQKAIDECVSLIEAVEGHWSPGTHKLFSPKDRRAVLELLRVGKRLEQQGTGLFLELWPYVLSFCGRGWFEKDNGEAHSVQSQDHNKQKTQTSKTRHHISNVNESEEEGIEDNSSISDSQSDERELTQFRLDDQNYN